MKKFTYAFSVFVTALLLGAVTLQAQTPISQWGFIGGRIGGWKFTPGVAGNVTVAGDTLKGNYSAVRGAFATVTPGTGASQALVVTGKIEFTGAGFDTWSSLRYGLFYSDSAGTLNTSNPDSTRWSGSEANAYGYLFTPYSGTNDPVSWAGAGKNGSHGGVVNRPWISTNGGNDRVLGEFRQKPARAVATAGIYSFAFSVQRLANGSNEIRFYLTKDGGATTSYYFGGTSIDDRHDTLKATKFNSVNFAVNNNNPNVRSMKLTNVNAGMGAPITVPEAPWSDYYVSDWGFVGGRIGGWKFTPGDVIGNATVSGDTLKGNYATLRGAFIEPVTPTVDKAVVVTGKIEFTGAGFDTWSSLRYGLFYSDSAGTLNKSNVDSTRWSGSEANAYGYLFSPYSGTNDPVSWAGAGKNGSHGGIVNRPWISTNGANDFVLGEYRQKPARAVATAGIYSFAISVQRLANGSSEIRFYLTKDGAPTTYYFGGTSIDSRNDTLRALKFNSVNFAVNNNNPNVRSMQLRDVKVSYGAPIVVPEAPWSPYYISDWGFIGGRIGGWKFTPGDVIGNASVSGDTLKGNYSTLRGAFVEPVTPTTTKAVVVTGKVEFVGAGFDTWSSLRFGLFYSDSAGTVNKTIVDSTRWTGTENNTYGYLFSPYSGTNDPLSWAGAGKNGTHGGIVNRPWISTNGANDYVLGESRQKPARAVATAGIYDFAISVQRLANGSSEIKYFLKKQGATTTYFFGGSSIDPRHDTLKALKFNSVNFAVNNNNPNVRAMHLRDVKVDYGTPIVVPEAPFSPYYISDWGFIGGRIGGWKYTPGDVIGNATISGDTLKGNYATLRGAFIEPIVPTTTKALIITGKMEFVGAGFDTWSSLRYGLFYSDSAGSLNKSNVDSTRWTGTENNTYGYLFSPYSGTNDPLSWAGAGKNGTHGAVVNRPWISTNGANDYVLGENRQKPARAVATAGVYNFAFSVQPKGDGTSEVRFYLIKNDTTYYFGGTSIDPRHDSLKALKFNSVNFAVNNNNPNVRGLKLTDVKVDLGSPITVPEGPWQDYYVSDWGFVGGRIGGWKFTPGDVVGNASVSGSAPNTGWSAVRGGLLDVVAPKPGKALKVTGKVEFVGGGFQATNSFHFGLFNGDSAGTINKGVVDSTRWTGKETGNFGYLFTPQSGANTAVDWHGTPGTSGGVVNGSWLDQSVVSSYVLGSNLHTPANAVAGAGIYNFEILVAPQANGSNYLSYSLKKSDNTYIFSGEKKYDTHAPVASNKFNNISFALNTNASTTAMNLIDVKVALVSSPTGVHAEEGIIPKEFALMQNYPNPFNPSTTIQYDVPKNSFVKIKVYDMLGRTVATLVDAAQDANRYSVQWNASNFGSGVYFYRIDAKGQDGSSGFTSVKKLLLVK